MGLLRGVARTAVVAGTATAVSNRVSRRQARRWGGQEAYGYGEPDPGYAQQPDPGYAQQPPPPAPAAAPSADPVERIKELAALRNSGVITDAEFAAAKGKILGA